MGSPARKSPGTATNSAEALQKKVQEKYTTWLIREMLATLTISLLVSVVMWSAIIGMSGNFGPGRDVVVGPVAEADHE